MTVCSHIVRTEVDFPHLSIWLPKAYSKMYFFVWSSSREAILTARNLRKRRTYNVSQCYMGRCSTGCGLPIITLSSSYMLVVGDSELAQYTTVMQRIVKKRLCIEGVEDQSMGYSSTSSYMNTVTGEEYKSCLKGQRMILYLGG